MVVFYGCFPLMPCHPIRAHSSLKSLEVIVIGAFWGNEELFWGKK